MTKNNFALMSVLYDNAGADLYNDIYFPIIKYGIATIHNTQSGESNYYDLGTLQTTIQNNFGITIPLIVLKQAVRAVANVNNEISIHLMDNGNSFKIIKAWNSSQKESIENKMQNTISEFRELESLFEKYLQRENLLTDKTFTNFFTDNCEEIFKYIDQLDSIPLINEDYVHLTKFLNELRESDFELFNVANSVFWGSVISAFLRREVDLNIKPTDSIEYYLDTSLIMSLLDLDTETNVSYAKELVELIQKSGNRTKVHSLTLKEVHNILYSVELDQIPRPNSSIESAYYRRDLTPSKIMQIRNNLAGLVTNKGVVVDFASDDDLRRLQAQYKGKGLVSKLEVSRGSISPNENSIRDIHDIFMYDYIKKKRGDISSFEKINSFFISLNSDLQKFFIAQRSVKEFSTIIHPSKVISSLWIHNSQCSIIKENALTETISRCMVLNNSDVKRKLSLISKYFNENAFNPDEYRSLYLALIDRSNRVLQEVSKIEILDSSDSKEKIANSQPIIQNIIKISIQERIEKEHITTKSLSRIETLEREMDLRKKEDNENKQKFERQIADANKRFEKEKNKNKRIAEIYEYQQSISLELNNLIIKRNNAVSMFKYWLLLSLESLAIVVLLVGLILLT